MNKKLVATLMTAAMVAGTMGVTAMAEEESATTGLQIGFAVQTLSNQIWAQQASQIEARAEADGNTVTTVDCQENANTQIDQIENFITSGMDVIIVQPVDPEAIEEVCGNALDEGITVVCWDEEMENSSFNWVIENYDLRDVRLQFSDIPRLPSFWKERMVSWMLLKRTLPTQK